MNNINWQLLKERPQTKQIPQSETAMVKPGPFISYKLLTPPLNPTTAKGSLFLKSVSRRGESRTKSVFPRATGPPQCAEETRRSGVAEQHFPITIITSRRTLDGSLLPSIKWIYRAIHFIGLNLVGFGFRLRKLPRMRRDELPPYWMIVLMGMPHVALSVCPPVWPSWWMDKAIISY